mgnify:CR=1 FL=1
MLSRVKGWNSLILVNFYILFVLLPSNGIEGFAYELTFVVKAGDMECFYQAVDSSNVNLEIEYQVE